MRGASATMVIVDDPVTSRLPSGEFSDDSLVWMRQAMGRPASAQDYMARYSDRVVTRDDVERLRLEVEQEARKRFAGEANTPAMRREIESFISMRFRDRLPATVPIVYKWSADGGLQVVVGDDATEARESIRESVLQTFARREYERRTSPVFPVRWSLASHLAKEQEFRHRNYIAQIGYSRFRNLRSDLRPCRACGKGSCLFLCPGCAQSVGPSREGRQKVLDGLRARLIAERTGPLPLP